jgi:lysophospholipid acyltransferase (LPLAT)-like uncharacterized protein
MFKVKLKYKIAAILISLLVRSWRIKISGNLPKSNAIVVFWHGKMLPGWYIFRMLNPIGVVSPSKDGEILSYLLSLWNYRLLRGSSNQNSKQLLEEIARHAKNNLIVMTPDGPKGPIYKMKAGAVVVAQRANVPIILCGIHSSYYKLFSKSWDRFMLPLPFVKVSVKLSDPFLISSELSREEVSLKIEELEMELNTL